VQWETKKVSKLISNQIDFLSQDYNLYYLNLIKKTIQIFFNHKFSSQMICLYIVTRSKLTEFIMLSEKKISSSLLLRKRCQGNSCKSGMQLYNV